MEVPRHGEFELRHALNVLLRDFSGISDIGKMTKSADGKQQKAHYNAGTLFGGRECATGAKTK